MFLTVLGLVVTGALIRGPIQVGGLGLDIGTMLYGVAITVVGYQAFIFAVLSKVYAKHEGFLPSGARFDRFQERLNLENLTVIGLIILVVGVVWTVLSLLDWKGEGFGALEARDSVRAVAPAVLGLIVGSQTVMAGLFLSLLRIRVIHPEPLVVAQV
jgi:hypothetical protein